MNGKELRTTIIETLNQAERILVVGHQRPDGDALGSVIAFARVLCAVGKEAVGAVATREGLGGPGCLDGVSLLRTPEELVGRTFDLLVTLDCAALDRIPPSLMPIVQSIPMIVNIDHHCTNPQFGTMNYVRGEASSTGELVWEILEQANWPVDRTVAEALWVSLVTDTGRFAYDTTAPSTLRCAASLLALGVRTSWLNDCLYCAFPAASMELKRRAYQTLSYTPDNRIAWLSLSGEDFRETNANKSDAEDVIEIPRMLAGNELAFFFYGDKENANVTRVSIRSRSERDVSTLASLFGGGGHAHAAGCTIQQPLEEAKKSFFRAVETWLHLQKPILF